MPIYEFSCNSCRANVSIFVRSMTSSVTERCDRCGGTELTRLISRVAVLKSGSDDDFDIESIGGGIMDGFDENDPKSMAAWAKKVRREMGDEMTPELEETMNKLERGETVSEDATWDDTDASGPWD